MDWNDAIDTQEVHYYESLHTLPYGSSAVVPPPPSSNNATIEKIPRILHQTWKSSLLPSKWAIQSKKCQEMHEDFEYKLWTDESSLEFIKEFYPWFLPTFLGYKFDIQRADAIRYFVLHKYGGVYMDLDIGGLVLISFALFFLLSSQSPTLQSPPPWTVHAPHLFGWRANTHNSARAMSKLQCHSSVTRINIQHMPCRYIY